MDRKWMFEDQLSKEYGDGVKEFINFALENVKNRNHIPCPCWKCLNHNVVDKDELEEHLIINGIDTNYTCWTNHGEGKLDSSSNRSQQFDFRHEESADVVVRNDVEEIPSVLEENLIDHPKLLEQLKNDAQVPLWDGCKFTKLDSIIALYNLKDKHGWTDSAFSDLLSKVKDLLPDNNVLPRRTYDAKQVLSSIGLKHERIHVLSRSVKEYHRRVLTAGHRVTKKKYFMKRRDLAEVEVHQLKEVMFDMQKQMHQMETQFEEKLQQIGSQILKVVPHRQGKKVENDFEGTPLPNVSPIHKSEKGSCSASGPALIPEVDGESNKGKSNIAYSMTQVVNKKAAYPREGVLDHVSCFYACRAYVRIDKSNKSYLVAMPESCWGVSFDDHISTRNMREVIERDWLGASSICLYIRYLCDVYLLSIDEESGQTNTNMVSSRFSFVSPHEELGHKHLVDMLLKHEGEDHLIMIPYNIRRHWVLFAINTKTECIAYMDPLRLHHSHTDRSAMVQKVNIAMSSYKDSKKQRVSNRRQYDHNVWINVECPKQPDLKEHCGFFVCLFIEDILQSDNTRLSLFNYRCDTFADSRITQLQHDWCGYLYNNYLDL